MTDIVKRLRTDNEGCGTRMDEAADIIESLRQQLAELEDDEQKAVERCVIAEQKLAQCQAREKVRINALQISELYVPAGHEHAQVAKAIALPSDSTALDTMLKQAKRDALLEAAEQMESYCGPTVYYELHRMANKLEETK